MHFRLDSVMITEVGKSVFNHPLAGMVDVSAVAYTTPGDRGCGTGIEQGRRTNDESHGTAIAK